MGAHWGRCGGRAEDVWAAGIGSVGAASSTGPASLAAGGAWPACGLWAAGSRATGTGAASTGGRRRWEAVQPEVARLAGAAGGSGFVATGSSTGSVPTGSVPTGSVPTGSVTTGSSTGSS